MNLNGDRVLDSDPVNQQIHEVFLAENRRSQHRRKTRLSHSIQKLGDQLVQWLELLNFQIPVKCSNLSKGYFLPKIRFYFGENMFKFLPWKPPPDHPTLRPCPWKAADMSRKKAAISDTRTIFAGWKSIENGLYENPIFFLKNKI